jgi:hypothetical protein
MFVWVKQYYSASSVSALTTWFLYFQAGFLLNYTFEDGTDEEIDTHTAKLNIFSPFDVLKLLDVTAFIEIQDKFYHTNFTLLTNQSHFTAGGDIEVNIHALMNLNFQ